MHRALRRTLWSRLVVPAILGIAVVAGVWAFRARGGQERPGAGLGAAVAEVEAGRRHTPLIGEPAADGSATVTFVVRSDGGKPPRVVMVVAVEEAFNHCPKAFVRAKLWDAMARPSVAPSHGDFAAARDGKDAAYAKNYNEKYAERLKTELY